MNEPIEIGYLYTKKKKEFFIRIIASIFYVNFIRRTVRFFLSFMYLCFHIVMKLCRNLYADYKL